MTYPTIGNYGKVAVSQGSPAASGTTGTFAVVLGDSVYVVIGYSCSSNGSIHVSSVTDTSSNTYKRLAIKQNLNLSPNPAQEVWCADHVPASGSLAVTVNFSASTWFGIVALEVSGASGGGSFGTVSDGWEGNTPVSSPSVLDPLAVADPNSLVIAALTFQRGIGAQSSGGGFTINSNLQAEPSGSNTNDVGTAVYWVDAGAAGSYDSEMYSASSKPAALVTVSIRFGVPWASGIGKPVVTVSPVGTGDGYPWNNGADFGPDTVGTNTQGLAEGVAAAIASLQELQVLPGTFILPGKAGSSTYPIMVTGPCTIRFLGCTIVQTYDNFCFDVSSASDVEILGDVTFQGLSSATHVCVNMSNSNRVVWRAKTLVTGIPTTGMTWMQAIDCSQCTLEGPFSSPDSGLIHITNSTGITIRNVNWIYGQGGTGHDPQYNIIRVDAEAGSTFSGIDVSDCYVDGGSALGSDQPYILVTAPSSPSSTPTDVTISNCVVKNAKYTSSPSPTGPGGIAVLGADRVVIANCLAYQMVFGFSLTSSNLTCMNCVAQNCYFPGFQVGDSTNQLISISHLILQAIAAISGWIA